MVFTSYFSVKFNDSHLIGVMGMILLGVEILFILILVFMDGHKIVYP